MRDIIPVMSDVAIDNVRRLETLIMDQPQIEFETLHVLHGGMYARTVTIPAGGLITGALIKIPTMLIISGAVTVYTDDGPADFIGYHVIPAAAGRKTAFLAQIDTELTMMFPTAARTVEEAEAEFTDETDLLVSRAGKNTVMTGDMICQA